MRELALAQYIPMLDAKHLQIERVKPYSSREWAKTENKQHQKIQHEIRNNHHNNHPPRIHLPGRGLPGPYSAKKLSGEELYQPVR